MHECNRCLKSYMALKNLRKHVKERHPGQLEELAMLPERKYKCCKCEKQYNTVEFLRKHEKREHNYEYLGQKEIYYCPICESRHFKKSNLIVHFNEEHQINIEESEHEFSSFKEFTNWKSKIESDTGSKFLKRGGRILKRKTQFYYFLCNRSGYPGIKQKKLLPLWSTRSMQWRSHKINGLCPASITAKCKQNGTLSVKYAQTHVGHENDSGDVPLSGIDGNIGREWNSSLTHEIDHDEIDHDKIDQNEINQDKSDQDEINHYEINQDENDQDEMDDYEINQDKNDYYEIEYDEIEHDEIEYDEIEYDEIEHEIEHEIEYDEIEHDEIDQDIDQLHSEWSCIIENVSTRDQIEIIKNHLKSMKDSIEILAKQNEKAPQNEIEYIFESSEEQEECDTQKIAPQSRAENAQKLPPQRKLCIVWNE